MENIEKPLNIEEKNETGFTIRAFLIGLFFTVFIAIIVPYNYVMVHSSNLIVKSFPMGAGIIFLLCIFIGNMLMKKILPSIALRSREILVVLVITMMACSFPGNGLMMQIGILAGPAYAGSSTNKYFDTLFKGVDAVHIKDKEREEIRNLRKEELYQLRKSFKKEENRGFLEEEFYRVSDSGEQTRVYPDEFKSYKDFLDTFTHASWDAVVPFDTVEANSIEEPPDELYYLFMGFPVRYDGPSMYEIVMRNWFKPLMLWMFFMLSICIMTLCIMTILRKQWVEKEKLLFPIARVPVELVEGLDDNTNPFFHNRIFWFGVLLPVTVALYRLVAMHTKVIPDLPPGYFGWVAERGIRGGLPFIQNAAKTGLCISLIIIGFTYLIKLDISFSIWFFHLFSFVETGFFNLLQIGTAEGTDTYTWGVHSYVNHQSIGGVIALVLAGLWVAREHIIKVFRKAFGGNVPELDDADEAVSYRFAVFGLILSMLFCTGWLMYIGMSWWVAVLFLVISMIFYIGITRVVCEGGIVFVMAVMLPQSLLLRSLGARVLGYKNLVTLSLNFFWISYVSYALMPKIALGMKIADTVGKKRKKWLLPSVIAVFLIVFFVTGGFIFKLANDYRDGLATGNRWMFYMKSGRNIPSGWSYAVKPIDELNKMEKREKTVAEWYEKAALKWPFDNFKHEHEKVNSVSRNERADYQTFVKSIYPQKYDVKPVRWVFTIAGFLLVIFLMAMRYKFLWWPLHPLGFPFAAVESTQVIWFSMFLGWLFKLLILKYGGIKLFNRLRPMFIGFIVGAIIGVGIGIGVDYLLYSLGLIQTGYSLG